MPALSRAITLTGRFPARSELASPPVGEELDDVLQRWIGTIDPFDGPPEGSWPHRLVGQKYPTAVGRRGEILPIVRQDDAVT